MKPVKILILSFFCLSFLLTISCKKDNKKAKAEEEEIDHIKPSLRLNGAYDMEIIFGETTEDPGATAVDNKDGNLDSDVKSNWKEKVDVNKAGSCIVDYSVLDKTGNQSNISRKVTVKRIASSYTGEYNSYTVFSGGVTPVITATVYSVFNSNQLVIYPFAGFDPTLIIDLKGNLGDELSFSQNSGENKLSGYGIISEEGRIISLYYKITVGSSVRENQQILYKEKVD